MPAGGKRDGAGRKPGSLNRATIERERTLMEAAKGYTDEALATLAAIMRDTAQPGPARVSAANAILDRGYGKPRQAVEHTGADGGPIEVTHLDDDALDRAEKALADLAGITGIPVGTGQGGEGSTSH